MNESVADHGGVLGRSAADALDFFLAVPISGHLLLNSNVNARRRRRT